MQKFWKLMKDLLAPAFCVNCRTAGSFLCAKCEQELLKLQTYKIFDSGNWRGNPLMLDKLIVCFNYREKGLLYKLFYYFKYGGVAEIAEVFGDYLKRALEEVERPQEYYVVPAPISRKRLKQRGFNQAKLLAEVLSNKCKLKICDCLMREDAPKQSLLSAEERILNLQNKFSLSKNFEEKLVGAKIILIDDVVTTAATMNEANKILRESGVKEVIGLALAKSFK